MISDVFQTHSSDFFLLVFHSHNVSIFVKAVILLKLLLFIKITNGRVYIAFCKSFRVIKARESDGINTIFARRD